MITKNDLIRMTDNINRRLGHEGTRSTSKGAYYVDIANGGYKLERINNDRGGAIDITPRGTAKEILFALYAIESTLPDYWQ